MKKVVSILLSVMMIMSVVVGTSVFADSTNNTDKKNVQSSLYLLFLCHC